MRRTRTTWLIFAGALLAAALTVGWLSLSVLKAERLARQMQQQAVLDGKARVALWRLDAIAAPLLALESSHSKFLPANEEAPRLSKRLVKAEAQRDHTGNWSVTPSQISTELNTSSLAAALADSDWWHKLVDPLSEPQPMDGASANNDLLIANVLTEYVDWPQTAFSQINMRNFAALPPFGAIQSQSAAGPQQGQQAQQQSQQGQQGQQQADIAARQQLVGQVSQLAVGSLTQAANQNRPTQGRIELSGIVGPYSSRWIGEQLVLARKVRWATSDSVVIECRILDWPQWNQLLTSQIADSFPEARLIPRRALSSAPGNSTAAPEWQMVSLPIDFEPQVIAANNEWSPSLIVAWLMLGLAACAVSWLLWQTQTLSERRAAFVSAVTHELRTPLTTFRLYTEMLSDGLVPDPEQQQTYFNTLAREANRLTHLVENVLSFARLERGRTTSRNESITVSALFERCEPRLVQRVAETSLQWSCDVDESARDVVLLTNVTAIEQILFNLVDNACKYANEATDPRLLFSIRQENGSLLITLRDFGPGLSAAARKNLFAAFEKSSAQAAETAPGIGLGLSLSRRIARDLGGELSFVEGVTPGSLFELQLR